MLEIESICRLSESKLREILKVSDWIQLRKKISNLLPTLGCCDFMIKMDILAPNGTEASHVFSSLPDSIVEAFSAHTIADPVNYHLANSNLPLSWQLKPLCISNAGLAYPRLESNNILHGISMAVRCKHANSRVDYYGNEIESYRFTITRQADLLLLGAYIHEAATLLWLSTAPNQMPPLTARELECLEWSGSGKNSAEIGVILGITQRTVYFHLQNAALKLGVHGSRHSVSRALKAGIINPQ